MDIMKLNLRGEILLNQAKKIILPIIAIIIIIIIVISIALLSLNKENQNNKEEKNEVKTEQEEYLNVVENPASVINGKKPKLVKIENIYYCTRNSINKYFSYINKNNTQAILSVLNKDYIDKNNLETSNILSAEFMPDSIQDFNIENMYSLDGAKYTSFYVEIRMDEKQIYLIINIDFENKTFDIIPSNQKEYEDKISTVVEGKTGEEEKIESNEYNSLETSNLKEEEIASKYLEDLINKMINNPQEAYKLLDEEYKNKRFKDFYDFELYIQNNKTNLQNTMLTKYSVELKDGYTQYTCIDNYENNYIFKVEYVMKYTVLLDNYTIETEEFKEIYNDLNESEKIATNVDKFIRCINNKDYTQAYAFLDEGFKNNYFKDISTFAEYIQNNFYNYNVLGQLNIKNEGNLFICEVPIKSGIGAGASTMKKIIIMKLCEGTDFVMSFSIE